ncbi:495_t:CDS:2, partial [Racocetra persica]
TASPKWKNNASIPSSERLLGNKPHDQRKLGELHNRSRVDQESSCCMTARLNNNESVFAHSLTFIHTSCFTQILFFRQFFRNMNEINNKQKNITLQEYLEAKFGKNRVVVTRDPHYQEQAGEVVLLDTSSQEKSDNVDWLKGRPLD